MGTSIAQRLTGVLLAVSALCGAQRVLGQAPPIVTGLSDLRAATITVAGAEPEPLALMMAVEDARLDVLDGQQVMLYSAAGDVVVVALGPTQLAIRVASDRVDLELTSGRLMTVSPVAQDAQTVYLVTPAAEGPRAVDCSVGAGRTFLTRVGRQVELGYLASEGRPGALKVTANGKPATVPSGQRLTVVDDTVRTEPLTPWLTENRFDALNWGRELGVSTARIKRHRLEERLFQDVIDWDREAQAETVIAYLEVEQFRPEIRQVAVAVAARVPAVTGAGARPQAPPFTAANEVPPLSPAAISVGGITALDLNAFARDLLTRTGSRGLGFNGPRQLAISGFGLTGVRTIGPAGLGAQ
jgi:hypothetical protein